MAKISWQKVFARTGVALLFMFAGCVISGQRGRAVFLWLAAVAFLGCALGIYLAKREG